MAPRASRRADCQDGGPMPSHPCAISALHQGAPHRSRACREEWHLCHTTLSVALEACSAPRYSVLRAILHPWETPLHAHLQCSPRVTLCEQNLVDRFKSDKHGRGVFPKYRDDVGAHLACAHRPCRGPRPVALSAFLFHAPFRVSITPSARCQRTPVPAARWRQPGRHALDSLFEIPAVDN